MKCLNVKITMNPIGYVENNVQSKKDIAGEKIFQKLYWKKNIIQGCPASKIFLTQL